MFGIDGSSPRSSSVSQPNEGDRWFKKGVIAVAISAITLLTANVIERENPKGALLIRVALGAVGLLWLFSKIFPSSGQGGSNQSFGAQPVRGDVERSHSSLLYASAIANSAGCYVPRNSFGGRDPFTNWSSGTQGSSTSQGGRGFPHVTPAATTTGSGLGHGRTRLSSIPESRGVGRSRAGDFPAVNPVTVRASSSLRGSPDLNPVPQSRGIGRNFAGDFPAVNPVTARTSSSLRGSPRLNSVPQSRSGDTHAGDGSRCRGELHQVPQSRK